MNTIPIQPKRILLVDDNRSDIELTLDALKFNASNLVVDTARDGVEALDYLYRRGLFANRTDELPVVVLLDLKMPRMDGLEVLRHVKSDPQLRRVPIVMVTSSREEQDLIAGYDLGVNAYVVKPTNYEEMLNAFQHLRAFWTGLNELPPTHS